MQHRQWLTHKIGFFVENLERVFVRPDSRIARIANQPRLERSSPVKTLLQANWVVRFVVVVMFSVAMFSVAWIGAHGQTTTATLSGVVHDPTGAVVPQTKITLRNIAKGTNRATSTDNDGRYNLSAVEPGTYELRAERTGFSTEVKNGVVLTVGASAQEDLTLRVGSASEVITVTDQAPLVETAKAE